MKMSISVWHLTPRHRLLLLSRVAWLLLTLLAFHSVQQAVASEPASIDACGPAGAGNCVPARMVLDVGARSGGSHGVLHLERNHAMLIDTHFDVSRAAVGDPEVADLVVVSARQVNLVPQLPGETNLILWGKGDKVRAVIDLKVGSAHARLERDLRRLLENETLRVDGAQEQIVLKGTVDSPLAMEQALRVANALLPAPKSGASPTAERVVNLLRVGANQQVMIEVIVAEMDRTLRRRLGTNFAGVYGSGGTDVSFFSMLQGLSRLQGGAAPQVLDLTSRVNFVSSIVKGSDSLDLFIEALQSDGLVKILAEPNLVARSGENAEFLVGGEVPIPIPQSGTIGTITIEFKQFGVGVNFTPTVLGANRIFMDVSTEVSEPNLTLGLETAGYTVPAFNTRRAATGVELADGESFAIAGLLRDDVTEVIAEFPGFGEIPVLGALFRSTQFERKKTELVIIATPRLVKPTRGKRPPLPTDGFTPPSAVEFFLKGSIEGEPRVDAGEVSAGPNSTLGGAPTPQATPGSEEVGAAGRQSGFAGAFGHAIDLSRAEGELP